MKLAITPSNEDLVLVLFDTDSKKALKINSDKRGYNKNADDTRPVHRPFGKTWNNDNIFIANRKNLLVYDSSLNFSDNIENILDENTHQITFYKNNIISTMTRKDCIKFVNLKNYNSAFFHPEKGWLDRAKTLDHFEEKFHINSVVAKDDFVYIMLHNRGENYSEILVLNLQTKDIEKRIQITATCAHGIYLDGDTLGTLNTREENLILGSNIIRCSAWKDKFLRGMAGEKQIAVANFLPQQRRYRGHGGSYISIVENNNVKKHCYVDNIGAVNDMRKIDGKDFCHHNEYKFPYTGDFVNDIN